MGLGIIPEPAGLGLHWWTYWKIAVSRRLARFRPRFCRRRRTRLWVAHDNDLRVGTEGIFGMPHMGEKSTPAGDGRRATGDGRRATGDEVFHVKRASAAGCLQMMGERI
nr:hypothetical protein Ade03nite_94960 [Actinoplanes derwentensis]